MPLIISLNRNQAKKTDEKDKQAAEIAYLAAGVYECLRPRFTINKFSVWENFPSEGYGGKLIVSSEASLLPEDIARATVTSQLSSPDSKVKDVLPEGLRSHHIFRGEGHFVWSNFPPVPAEFSIGFYGPWAEDFGDITFDTYPTSAVRKEGAHSLMLEPVSSRNKLCNAIYDSLKVRHQRLMTGREASMTLRRISLQSDDDPEEVAGSYYMFDSGDRPMENISAKFLLSRIRERMKGTFTGSPPGKWTDFSLRSISDTVQKELVSLPEYSKLVTSELSSRRIFAKHVGSYTYTSDGTGTLGDVMNSISDKIEAQVTTILRNRLDQWGELATYLRKVGYKNN